MWREAIWLDCGYITQQEHEALYTTYENIAGGLVKMMANPDTWCGPAQLRESSAPYFSHTPTLPYPKPETGNSHDHD